MFNDDICIGCVGFCEDAFLSCKIYEDIGICPFIAYESVDEDYLREIYGSNEEDT